MDDGDGVEGLAVARAGGLGAYFFAFGLDVGVLDPFGAEWEAFEVESVAETGV